MLDEVAALVREVSAAVIEPRFSALQAGDVEEKSPGEVVTIADREAEVELTRRLGELVPGVPVVGEEACAVDPSLADALLGERAWLVDPIDGTANFVDGSPDWAVMVALVEKRTTVASWIWRPTVDRMYVAERGGGASCNGEPLRRGSAAEAPTEVLRGAVLRRFLDATSAANVERNCTQFGEVTSGRLCAGVDYPSLAEGAIDFVLFWRTLPWDHAPGVLLALEAGCTVLRLDGSDYDPAQEAVGLLAAADPTTWERARTILD